MSLPPSPASTVVVPFAPEEEQRIGSDEANEGWGRGVNRRNTRRRRRPSMSALDRLQDIHRSLYGRHGDLLFSQEFKDPRSKELVIQLQNKHTEYGRVLSQLINHKQSQGAAAAINDDIPGRRAETASSISFSRSRIAGDQASGYEAPRLGRMSHSFENLSRMFL